MGYLQQGKAGRGWPAVDLLTMGHLQQGKTVVACTGLTVPGSLTARQGRPGWPTVGLLAVGSLQQGKAGRGGLQKTYRKIACGTIPAKQGRTGVMPNSFILRRILC